MSELGMTGQAPSRRRRWVAGTLLGLSCTLVLEAALPPRMQPTAHLGIGLIRVYQATLSPLIAGSGVRCRFEPSCSHYGELALRKHGTIAGGCRTLWRVVRCAPWGPPPGEIDTP